MLQRCENTNLVLNWEKCHFMVKEGIVLGHKISKSGIEVDKSKFDVIVKLPHPTTVKGAENLAADHLSRLENLHQSELEKNEITKTFPLETLGMVTFRGNDTTHHGLRFCKLPCAGKYCDQRNVVPTEKKVIQKTSRHSTFGMTPFVFKILRIK
ncbi:hypothetical protein Tco_0366795 [Tanacetum coccineum]